MMGFEEALEHDPVVLEREVLLLRHAVECRDELEQPRASSGTDIV